LRNLDVSGRKFLEYLGHLLISQEGLHSMKLGN